jgi:hypothetical protein
MLVINLDVEQIPFTFIYLTAFYLRTLSHYQRSEVLAGMAMERSILWDIKPCSPLKGNGRSAGKYLLHLQGRGIKQAKKQAELILLHFRFLLDLFFDRENGGEIYLRNNR